jgi:hypothetical protein
MKLKYKRFMWRKQEIFPFGGKTFLEYGQLKGQI